MRVSKPKKPVEVTCIECGCTFTALTRKALRCEKCKVIKYSQYRKRLRVREKERERVKEMPHLRPKLSMAEVLSKLEEYNKEHNTHLSYGKFVLMLEGANGNN